MNILSSYNQSIRALSLTLMALLLTLATPPAEAQTTGVIHIGGKVYGGGKEGAILSGNTSATNVTEAKDVALTNKAFDNTSDATYDASQASQVTINSAAGDEKVQITAVFGGGEQGRAYGKTNVTINGGTIGVTDATALAAMPAANKSVNGNAFGAGDGRGADVFGGSHILITAGTINGSVYGGGNQADLVGSTELTLQGGKYVGAVFGGAKQADIFGRTFVNVDGLNAKNDLHIIDVYGGNDIAGSINPSENWDWTKASALATLPLTLANTDNLTKKPDTVVDGKWNAFVLATDPATSTDDAVKTKKVLIDNIYGGGNGDYDYATTYSGLRKPVIDRTYLQIEGGMYGSLYGGGNAATVAVSTDICLVNGTEASSTYLASLEEPSKSRFSADYQFNRVFGGNNKEPMAIRPNWYLKKATVNNLYSGGNAGPMTYFQQTSMGGAQSLAGNAGIIIHVESDLMTINNVYGGCRMADVDPNGHQGADMTINEETFGSTTFQRNYAARVLITGGNINNVYGGNDVSGNVYYGSQVEILSSINGDVYGAGNGSYAYTDNASLKNNAQWSDYYYEAGSTGLASARALSNHRPNAEKTYVHVAGTASEPTYIGGALYCGGNSATLRTQGGSLANAKAELHIGSYVISDKVFLGSNGANMVDEEMLKIYANRGTGYPAGYSSLTLTNSDQFEEYMRGVEVAIKPNVSFDADYVDYTAKFGSLYCGGNVGSMSAAGVFNIDFLKKVIIYDKLVGGSNNANVAKTDYNAFHLGGLIGAPDASGTKVQLNIAGLLLEPRILTRDANNKLNIDTWNKDTNGMLQHGNIYGGCYASGYVNGGVTINVKANAIGDNVFTGSGVTYDAIRDDVLASTLSVYGGGYGKEAEIWGNTTINITDNGQIMKAYGGGEMGVVGKLERDAVTGVFATESVDEWYPTKINKTVCTETFEVDDYASRPHTVAQFADGGTYNTTVNLNATLLKDALDNPLNNVAKLYAGGFQGTVSGNTIANLNRGRAYDAFGGASNADILGHAETYVGKQSAPTITHNVYGANDFGGLIVGTHLFAVDNTNNEMEKIVAQTYVEYHSGHIGDGSNLAESDANYLEGGNLFGGPCGAYEYSDDRYFEWDLTDPANPVKGAAKYVCKPMLLKDMLTRDMLVQHGGAGYGANSFVNIVSNSTIASDYIEGAIFGAGQGKKGRINSADERGSYVRLASATTSQRTTGPLSRRVYGAGYCSNTNRSLVDAYTGNFGTIFGAAHGITYEEVLDIVDHNGTYETNYMGYRSAVRLHDMVNRQMDIYGGGANAGAQETGVVLNGGQARNVYGASYDQGITYAATVEVPEASTTKVNAIFGGAKGKSDVYPCDVYNTFITWHGENARVNDAIYGGNDAFRMTRNSYIAVSKPVKNYEDKLTDVFGGGFGENTVTLYTSVSLQDGAEVANVYGGGNNGQVLDTPSFRYYLDDGKQACADGTTKTEGCKNYPEQLLGTGYGYQKYLKDTEVNGFHAWIMANYWNDCRKDDRKQPLGSYLSNAHGHAHDLYFLSTQMKDMKNTNVYINQGALVAENAYGGGFGAKALVSGETAVHLWGGTVEGDIYGGGYGGDVAEYPHLIYPAGGQHELTMSSTHVDLQGGQARNVYGGGLNGHVVGSTDVVLGTKDQHEFDFYGTTIRGENEHRIIYGDPIVERSLYGGGQNGHVNGTAYLTINQGHVGYKYDASQEVQDGTDADGNPIMKSTAACYVENLDLNDEGDNFLDQNGNAFGAGYGEGAYVDQTYVNMYGGTIRNSLYGGGEIAAVGQATMAQTGAHPQVGTISVPGRTHIYMYNGLVQGDVFGGGRGYSYDLTGNEVVGKLLYTDGYVFGTTNVEIRGGVVGTEKTVADGHGNVFGGGNIGYCFTDAAKHGVRGDEDGEGRYYTNAWKCNECGYIDYEHNMPTVCGNENCKKSTTATDAYFRTTFTQVNADGSTTGVQNEAILSEDCRVVISPWAQVIAAEGITIKGNNKQQPDGSILKDSTFVKGSYVPTEYLSLLKDKNTDKAQWDKLSNAGVTVRNAVFAGGNISSGSDKVYANAYTVYGNATASVNDVFFRDFITLGTEHIGGLYGDGNLTFVDGYRELNITNFGTDYYGQQDHITLEEYNKMNDRERAYFELEYQTKSNHTYNYYICNEAGKYGGIEYARGQHISVNTYNSLSDAEKSHFSQSSRTYDPSNSNDRIKQSDYDMMTAEEQDNWEMFGFCSIYAGRLLNTIQRADFCGVFGSRLVLQGAQDRVPEVVDYTQYTINRVGELSLNKKEYEGAEKGGLTADALTHGNYFGMYNIVNYLGALTSDVDFGDVRTTDNEDSSYKEPVDGKAYGTATYYDWKKGHQGDRKRNNGTCHNTVALAAGVYLEIVEEPKTAIVTPDTPKEYGYITGVVQLDLINVMPGLGGGYVYAKNVHKSRSGNSGAHDNLSIYNASAVNNSAYKYEGSDELIETSGNFIHNVKRIVDDCFPGGGDLTAPAHYWYIRGDYYVYDQYISAFTGSSTAYSENINLPLTITAGANGRLDLIEIKQNYYAYWKDEEMTSPLTDNDAIVVNAKTYGLNDIITWWDYMQLSDQQKKHFVKETYVATMDYCTADAFDSDGNPANVITKGEVLLPGDSKLGVSIVYYDPEDITTNQTTGVKNMKPLSASDVFHVSNAVSHDNGYVLAVKLDNPVDWDSWYSPQSGAKKINQTTYSALADGDKTNHFVGPTYYTTQPGVYGQHQHVLDEIVTQTAVTAYNAIPSADITALENEGKHQATVSAAYVAVTAAEYDYGTQHKNVQAGVGISAEEYAALDNENKAKFSPAYTCLSTFEEDASNAEYIYFGTLIPASKYQELRTSLAADFRQEHGGASDAEVTNYVTQVMNDHFDKAYIVTSAGYYGGQHFEANKNYRALDTWATLSAEDRKKFQFRYDALDVLLFSNTSKEQGYYPATATTPETGYYPGTGEEGPGDNNIMYYDGPYWYAAGTDDDPKHQIYGQKQPIDYTAKYDGTTALTWTDASGNSHTITSSDPALDRETYEDLPNEQRHYSAFRVDEQDKVGGNFPTYYIIKESFISGGTNYAAGKTVTADTYNSFDDTRKAKIQTFNPTTAGTYYICREGYTIGEKGEGHGVTNLLNSTAIADGSNVPAGAIISSTDYGTLVNKQIQGFTIHGISPTETSTFYVNRESNIFDLSQDRVVTVIYQYKYEESDESGNNVEEITERHVINIHITFKSGVPTIGKLQDPSIVLPGQTVGLKSPGVTPGAYEILGAGWELFTNPEDAEKHTNGKTYVNNATPMYWYQDGYYVAYYAKTYLGKTYSNSVPFKVANYHDIADVMADNQNYMYIDHPHVKRNSKIYINDNVVEDLTVNHADAVDADGYAIAPVVRTESEIDMLYSLFQNSLETSLKETTIDVQEQEEDASGNLLYWEVDGSGKPTSTKTTTVTAYPVQLYWDVDAAGNKDTSKPKTTTITAYPVTNPVAQNVPVFNNHVRNLANLDFYLSENVSTAKDGDWEPIGTYDNEHPENNLCFMGTLHGMGYTISGLEESLFANLCGYVYNLGVTGSFTRSGVADRVSEGTVPDTGDTEKSIEPTKVYGHVNSSWIYTSAEPDAVAAAAHNVDNTDPEHPVTTAYLPVVGVPNDLSLGLAGVHTLNCYFPEECGYPMGILSRGPNTTANSATLREFNNGEVAYNLNGFYLNKRYSDNALSAAEISAITGHTTPATGDAATYKYWKQQSDGTLEAIPTVGYYKNGGSMHAYNGQNLGYVERLFADGDFVYQHGTIPLQTNERYSTSDSRYLPVWPDDYYFFGQQLTYGYDETERPYQPLPNHVRKTISVDGSGKDNRLLTIEQNNIVYRIPAYFRSAEKKWTHFNPYAVFADHMKEDYTLSAADLARGLDEDVLDGRDIHPGLTALDFTGHNDFTIWTKDHKFYGARLTDPKLVYSNGARNITDLVEAKSDEDHDFSPLNDGAYFGPITDYTTIMSFETHDITQNLLTYAPTTTYSGGTANALQVLDEYFNEPAYDTYYNKVKDAYRTVAALDESTVSGVHGHLVMKENSAELSRHYYYAASDHFLVDKQDFNAPFEYEFNPAKGGSTEYRMWYQRTPDNYAGVDADGKVIGWEGVSLPFAAELVSTQDKGEITHFYKNATSDYAAGYNSGHEYWLREFTGIVNTTDDSVDPAMTTTTASMTYPVALGSSAAKTATNTFLWDYYYNADGKDLNGDDYRNDVDADGEDEQDLTRYYYGQTRQYANYPLSEAGKPYIAGFPGSRYYEFDLSGTFVPEHSGTITPDQLDAQTISFVSNTGITIRVSDEEMDAAWDESNAKGTDTKYVFAPNYLNDMAPNSVVDGDAYYVLNAEGSAYEKTTAATPVAAFRPYFATANASRLATRAIIFGMGSGSEAVPGEGEFEEQTDEDASRGLKIYAKRHQIVIESNRAFDTRIRITNLQGVIIANFLVAPGEKVAYPVNDGGIYMVNRHKLQVK